MAGNVAFVGYLIISLLVSPTIAMSENSSVLHPAHFVSLVCNAQRAQLSYSLHRFF